MKLDVSGVHYLNMVLGRKVLNAKEEKKAKQLFTICLIASAAGRREDPIVIWKSENEMYRCI